MEPISLQDHEKGFASLNFAATRINEQMTSEDLSQLLREKEMINDDGITNKGIGKLFLCALTIYEGTVGRDFFLILVHPDYINELKNEQIKFNNKTKKNERRK